MKRYHAGLLTLLLMTTPLSAQWWNVTDADLALFPANNVVERELEEADRRYDVLRRLVSLSHELDNREMQLYWGARYRQSFDVWSAWNDLHFAQKAANGWKGEGATSGLLYSLREKLGPKNYYHGQLPPHVPVPMKGDGK